MKALLCSKIGAISACIFAAVMAIVIQRVLSRQAGRRAEAARSVQVGAATTGVKAGTIAKAGLRDTQAGTGAPKSREPATAAASPDASAQRELAYLDRYQKSGSKSRIDRDRQGRAIIRRRTANPISAAGATRGRAVAALANLPRLRLQGRAAGDSDRQPAGEKTAVVADTAVALKTIGVPPGPADAGGENYGFVPYGRPLKCELVFTIDSTLDESPVVALVVEPVYNNGVRVVPAGAELHGVARPDRLRDRLFSGQDWVLVMPRGETGVNGRAMHVKGLALDRAEPTGDALTWGITDGSLGLQGSVIRTMEFDEVKRFAATFVSAAALGLQEREGVRGTSRVASTPRNAALQGIAVSLEDVARKIAEEVGRNGVFLRVPGGKQFYFYPQQAIVPEEATAPRGPALPAAGGDRPTPKKS